MSATRTVYVFAGGLYGRVGNHELSKVALDGAGAAIRNQEVGSVTADMVGPGGASASSIVHSFCGRDFELLVAHGIFLCNRDKRFADRRRQTGVVVFSSGGCGWVTGNTDLRTAAYRILVQAAGNGGAADEKN